jgi:hypothetical protein
LKLCPKQVDISEVVARAASVERDYLRTSNPQGVFATREEFYNRVTHLLTLASREVLDSSWGPDPPKQDETIEQARAHYRHAAAAARRRGLTYIELHAALSQQALHDIEDAIHERQVGITVLTAKQMGAAPRFEFIVIDRTKVLLSRAYAGYASSEEYFLEISDTRFASFMAHHFEECERLGQKLGQHQGGAIIDANTVKVVTLISDGPSEL